MNYSAAVSSCFKEAGGKLAVFTANIVERFSHPNKTEAKKEKEIVMGVGGVYTQNFKAAQAPEPSTVQCKLFQRFGGCCWLPA